MVRMTVKIHSDVNNVIHRAERANIESLGHAGAAIRLTARRSIRRRKKPSPEGSPPSTRQGALKKALRYAVEKDKEQVTIGPDHSVVGISAAAHEHGGRYKRQRYRRRPFMGPALEKVKSRLPKFWAGSVK